MSLCRCRHLDIQLPDNETCGGRCPDFPACVPPLPRLSVLAHARELDEARAVDETLQEVHAAILKGLER